MKCGRLLERVKDRALDIIDTGADLKRQCEERPSIACCLDHSTGKSVGRATDAALMLLDVLAKNLAARFILRKDGEQAREPISLRFSRDIHPKAATKAWRCQRQPLACLRLGHRGRRSRQTSANASAMARPRPRDAPVTSVTRLLRSKWPQSTSDDDGNTHARYDLPVDLPLCSVPRRSNGDPRERAVITTVSPYGPARISQSSPAVRRERAKQGYSPLQQDRARHLARPCQS